MILIAHRGNITGPNAEMENEPSYVLEALKTFDVEIDVWLVNGDWWLGHDSPQYQVPREFLATSGLWIHCKDYITLCTLLPRHDLNVFYHTDEDYVITSRHFIWAYPGMPGGGSTICVMPERNDSSVEGFDGICSDYIGNYI